MVFIENYSFRYLAKKTIFLENFSDNPNVTISVIFFF